MFLFETTNHMCILAPQFDFHSFKKFHISLYPIQFLSPVSDMSYGDLTFHDHMRKHYVTYSPPHDFPQ